MSKSRLEKFLYALYSLDSSDLPNPLSRIEELYNCWVTGEKAPTFKPLSRVEKYLMAILGVYDVDSLPNPLSRVEVLLYKLATGDDNLDYVKSFLSEHEELLAEIIKNGGVGGSIDIKYVLYTLSTEFNTLYNTAEKPVKSAILKGNTLVNLSKCKNISCVPNIQFSLTTPKLIGGNKTYILIFTHTGVDGDRFSFQEYETENGWIINHNIYLASNTPKQYYIFTTKENTGLMKIQSAVENNYTLDNLMLLEYQEGMENWDIPYFEGMQSVKMPVLTTTGKNFVNSEMEIGNFKTNDGSLFDNAYWQRSSDFIALKSNTQYQLNDTKHGKWFLFYDKDRNFINGIFARNGQFTTPYNCESVKFSAEITDLSYKWQIELGNTITEYEPYKSNILTCNEDVTLRSNGNICDELNLLTGQLTQRIDEDGEVLSQEVVKTVDLSAVDQDGNNTKLKTFNDITHVTLSSEGLIPEAELEVATKNEEVLNTMSLEMDDISTTHNILEETVNTQSENIDSTMIATTEIYEELL